MRKSEIACDCWRALGGRGYGGCRGWSGGLKRVFSVASRAHQPVCDGNQEGARGVEVVGWRGANKPSVAEGVAQGVRIEVGKGGFQLDSGVKENGEQSVSRRSSLGPRRGPRGSTTTVRRHTRGMCWLCPK